MKVKCFVHYETLSSIPHEDAQCDGELFVIEKMPKRYEDKYGYFQNLVNKRNEMGIPFMCCPKHYKTLGEGEEVEITESGSIMPLSMIRRRKT